MIRRKLTLWVMCGALLGIATQTHAQNCISNMRASTDPNQFINNGDGTITDLRFGLMWSICTLGQTYEPSTNTCTGTATQVNDWSEALQAQDEVSADARIGSYTDWRLPNIKELRTIVERSCWQPSIRLNIFPDTLNGVYWSNTPNTAINDGVAGQVIDFSDAAEFIRPGDNRRFVRLVRTTFN